MARNEYPPLSAEEHARIKAKLAKSPDVHVLDLEAVAGPTSFELRDGRILRLAFLTPPTDPKTVRAAERRLRQIFLDTRGVVYTTSKQLFEKSEGKVTAQANVVLDGLVLVDAASALVQEGLARARSEGDTPSPIMYQRDP